MSKNFSSAAGIEKWEMMNFKPKNWRAKVLKHSL